MKRLLVGFAAIAAVGCASDPVSEASAAIDNFATTPDGVRLYYRSIGEGDDVLIAPFALYHGSSLDALAEGRRIVTYDPRGRGRSGGAPAGALSLDHLLIDFETVRQATGAEKVSIIGWSGAGMEMFVYTLRNKERDSIPAGIGIEGISSDSRKVEPGTLFVAVQGDNTDGHNFIRSAIERGASAVIGETILPFTPTIPYVQVPNSRQALGTYLAAAFYGFPARKMTMIGVTGTDGKTTTCNLLYRILITADLKPGMISTVNAVVGDEILDTGFHVTTPDALEIQRYFAMMAEKGLTHVILETTSHGWAQYRVDACEFDVGVVTNITHEHLDYHGTFEKYREAKARLFTELGKTHPKRQGNITLGVLNRDDSSYGYLQRVSHSRLASYGKDSASDFRADNVAYSPSGISFDVLHQGEARHVTSPLIGEFNVSPPRPAARDRPRGRRGTPPAASRPP